ncbi:cytochrome P450 [Aspergillus karnatakaensis]|uniref:cytochrome P450 n=1 Tax=Aspergillus karnatakaensis TaxID=1810916 RepID=UPI003CCE17A5
MPDNPTILLYITSLALGWLSVLSAYRLWLHPLRRIPGPKLAAITHLYELYFDAIKGGKYIWQIEKMHERYGPVVRINPREVHIKDSTFYSVIYAGGRRDKDPESLFCSLIPDAVLTTVDHDHHKLRRHIIDSFFSKQSVAKLDGMIREKVRILLGQLGQARRKGTVVELHAALGALTSDVISEYMYGESLGSLHAPRYRTPISDSAAHTIGWLHYVRFYPAVFRLAWLLPVQSLGGRLSVVGPVLRLLQFTRDKADEYLAGTSKSGADGEGKKTIFSALVAETVPPHEKSRQRLVAEVTSILAAGTDTTARTGAVALFYLARNPVVLKALRKELFESFSLSRDKGTWVEQEIPASSLERLPYLTAVVRESLRLAHPAILRSSRVAAEPVMYKDIAIPSGTPISQSIYFVSMDPDIFPDPETFNPDRWIDAAANEVNLHKHLVTFTQGSRQCLGISLTYAELYHLIAAITCTFDWQLHETDLEDIRTTRDFHLAMPECGFYSAKVIFTGMKG